jgi:hypothetical protein
VVMAAALAARDYEAPDRSDVVAWALPVLHAAAVEKGCFSFYATERVDQGSKMDGTRHYGSDLQNSLRKRSQFLG